MHVYPGGIVRLIVSGMAIILVAGCSNHDDKGVSGLRGVSSGQADQLNADRSSKFDAVRDPPLNAETHFAAGQLADAQNAWDRGVVQYQAALKLKPNFPEALFRLGVDYMHLKQYPQAIATWKQYIKATNESATGYSNLGFAQYVSGDPAAAEASYRKGIERDPKNQHCRVNYGVMLAMQDRISDATLQFQAVLSPAEVHYNLGSVYEQRGKIEQARSEYAEALKLDPKLTDAQTRLASLK
jgi:tetratricopeptide (TPR) repeat protein